jgi:hypothetical protein
MFLNLCRLYQNRQRFVAEGIIRMRVDRNDPSQTYRDFFDWITCEWRPVLIITLVFAYLYYLLTTEENGRPPY